MDLEKKQLNTENAKWGRDEENIRERERRIIPETIKKKKRN